MDIRKLENFLEENKLPKFRLGQIQKAIFTDGVSSFSEITTLSKELREKMSAQGGSALGGENTLRMLSFEIEKVLIAKDEQSIKALLKLEDGELVETVLISPKPGIWSACISCQVGCAMGCRFCATGKMGFKRNLSAEEITDQILFWKQYLKGNFKMFGNCNLELGTCNVVNNIVYMGMGEPFNNWKNVSESIRNLTDEKLFGFGSRSISVSTSGIAEGIGKLATEFPQVNLAISLHFSSDEKRDRYMPVNKLDNMESLRNALKKYFEITNRKVFLEYIMLDGINDTALDAKLLSDFVYSIGKTQLLHVNLIRYNTIIVIPDLIRNPGQILKRVQDDIILKPSSKTRTQNFKAELEKHRISATIRKSLGDEIKAACGQLAGK